MTEDKRDDRQLAPRDVVLNLVWDQLNRILTSKDATAQPTLMFEELEPIMEACYEAGQDSEREWEESGGITQCERVRFGTWWRTPPPTNAQLQAEVEKAKAEATARRMTRWSYGCEARLVLPEDTQRSGAVMWAECSGCGARTERYPFRQGGAPARAGREAALATEAAGRLLYVGWVDVSVLMEWQERHMEFVSKSLQVDRKKYKLEKLKFEQERNGEWRINE